MAASDADSQSPIFWERLTQLFTSTNGTAEGDGDDGPRQGVAIAVCIVIASVLWLGLTLRETKTVTLEVPTRVVNLPEDAALASLPPKTVRVQVRGQAVELILFSYNRPRVPIDATSSQVNVEDALDLSRQQSLQIESVTPQRVDVATEPRIQRRVPIRSRVDLKLPTAHELLRPPRLEPDSVTVTGAKSLVEGVEAWPTQTVTIDELRDSVRTDVALTDSLTELLSVEPRSVTFAAEAGKFADAQREIEVEVTGVPSNQNLVALDPATIRVRYRVLFDELFESQRVGDFFATVSYSQIRSDTTGYVEPRVHVPADLYIRDPRPIPRRLRYYTFVSGE